MLTDSYVQAQQSPHYMPLIVYTSQLASTHLPPEDLNAGLLDQNLALQFLQQNAKSFGGVPSKITVWGQSAGNYPSVTYRQFVLTIQL